MRPKTIRKYGNRWAQIGTAIALLLVSSTVHAQAENWRPKPENSSLKKAQLEQKLGSHVPLDIRFRRSTGDRVKLAQFFGKERPVILALGYVECPNLCTLVHQGMVHSLQDIKLEMGQDFDVVSLSIDPDEPLALTRSARQRYLQMYGRKGAQRGWHSLIGEQEAIQVIADAIGFRYAYDDKEKQYSHPGALIILTPEGKISRYFSGVTYAPSDMRLALVEASGGRVGSPVDKVLLRCFAYDPSSGEYSLQVMRVVRYAGGFTVVIVLLGVFVAFRRSRRAVL